MKTSTEELRRAAEQAIAARGGGQQVESPASALRRFREQVEPEDVLELLERTSCMMGVGDGSGGLFVHGTYDSVKAAQGIVLERDALLERVGRLEEALRKAARDLECGSSRGDVESDMLTALESP